MDEFLKIEDQNLKEKKGQKGKKKNFADKKRVARLKKTFLPYWARETELESKEVNDVDVTR
jgi:hypothetical protein